MDQEPAILDAIRAIVAGNPVDWATVDSGDAGGSYRGVVRDLKILARVADLHRTLHEPSGGSSHPSLTAGVRSDLPAWGPLTLLERIGDGSFGVVYRAWDGRLEREVALKLLRGTRFDVRNEGSNAVREGRLLARLRHPNVATVYGADEHDGSVGIWMELVRGKTLASLVRERGCLDVDEAREIGLAVCRALTAVHRAGLVHRDVKAQNVMRDEDGRIVLMDFGTGYELAQNHPGAVAGTPAYIAPEVVTGEPASPQSDIYSVGVLLFHLVSGSYPVPAPTLAAARTAHQTGQRQALASTRPDLPAAFVDVVERAAAPCPSDRFESAELLEAALLSTDPSRNVASADAQSTASQAAFGRRTRRMMLAAAAIAVAAALGALSAMVWRHPRPAVAFNARNWVLVTAFDNRSGDPSLGETVEYALESELANSRYVNVVPRIRAEDSLRLMGKPPDTRIDAAIGREICVRDGGIHALVSGRIDKVGTAYLLTATMSEAASAQPLTSVTESSSGPGDLSRAIRQLSNSVRESFGEDRSAIRQTDQQLERVTTPSLQALRLYTESYRFGDRRQWKPALELAQQAVVADPNFASARIWLAWALRNTGRAAAEYRAESARAVSLAAGTAEWERYWIVGSDHYLRGEFEEAAASYGRLLQLNPDHRWAPNNLATAYRNLGRPADAIPLTVRIAQARPNSIAANWDAMMALYAVKDFAQARQYASRVIALTIPSGGNRAAEETAVRPAIPRFFAAHEAWFKGDAGATLSAVDRIVHDAAIDNPGRTPAADRDDVLHIAVSFYVAMGKPVAAEEAAGRIANADLQHIQLAYLGIVAGDRTRLREQIGQVRINLASDSFAVDNPFFVAWLLTKAGMTDTAAKLIDHEERIMTARDAVDFARAHIALARGDTNRAVALLRPILGANVYRIGANDLYRAADTLSEALIRRNDLAGAAEAIRSALSWRNNELPAFNTGAYWMPLQLRLAELDARLGRVDEARRLGSELAQRLAIADPQFPLLQELRRLRQIPAH
jgi:tetratricopeptide (TPR) repeat protein